MRPTQQAGRRSIAPPAATGTGHLGASSSAQTRPPPPIRDPARSGPMTRPLAQTQEQGPTHTAKRRTEYSINQLRPAPVAKDTRHAMHPPTSRTCKRQSCQSPAIPCPCRPRQCTRGSSIGSADVGRDCVRPVPRNIPRGLGQHTWNSHTRLEPQLHFGMASSLALCSSDTHRGCAFLAASR